MDNIIARAALGQSAQLGDLYDARSDTFCGVSLLKRAPPASALTSQDNPSIKTEFILSDSISNKFEKLDVSAELKVSVLAGLFKLEGHGRYLSEERKSARSVSGSFLYNISTKVDSLNVFSEGLFDCIALNALNNVPSATHVVVQIGWGANAMLTLDYMSDSREQNRDIGGALQAKLEKLAFSREGQAEVTYSDTDDSKSTKFALKVFADVLPTGESVPQTVEEAIAYMKKIPSLVQAANDGKGKPLQFKLLPLSMLKNCLKIQNMANRIIHQLDEGLIARVTELFEKIQGIKQQLNDLYREMQAYQFCIETKDIEEVGKVVSAMSIAEAGLRSDLGKTLVLVRAGDKKPQDIEMLIKSFFESEASPDKITTFIHNHSYIDEKIQYVIDVLKEKVIYIGKGISIDGEKSKNSHGSFYVFFCKSADDLGRKEVGRNRSHFHSLAKQYNSSEVDEPSAIQCMLVDLDVRPDLSTSEGVPDGTRICLFMNGSYILTDVVDERMQERKLCSIKTTVKKEFVKQKPNNCVDVELVCPNARLGQCPDKRHKWKCNNCNANVEYCFDDKQFYCKCGRAPMDCFIFRCDSVYHGDNYIAYEKEIIWKLTDDFRPLKEVNILILGETGVGKSTWINSFANYLNFLTLEDAIKSDPLYLIPTFFTATDKNGVLHTITIGESKHETFSTDGQSATQEPFAHVFSVKDMKIRLIDTPGIGDVRGIKQDKINFDKILLYLSYLNELHGICILLKPDNARLSSTFTFCITELLLHLHRSAANNIMFCFTCTRSTDYEPGETLPPLMSLLKKFQDDRGVSIPLVRNKTMFCVDNECFRFICATHNKVEFSEKLKNNKSESWNVSVEETSKIIHQILLLSPHRISETVSLNNARKIIVNLTAPMAEMSKNIKENIEAIKQRKEQLKTYDANDADLRKKLYIQQIHLVAKTLPGGHPRTVCASAKCVATETIPGTSSRQTIYKTICHDNCRVTGVTPDQYPNPLLQGCVAMGFFGGMNCKKCECSWDRHLHITYEYEQRSENVVDKAVEELIKKGANGKLLIEKAIHTSEQEIKELNTEHQTIMKAIAKFGSFLKTNAIVPYNDAFDGYVQLQIETQHGVVAAGGNEATLKSLKELQAQYKLEVEILDKAMADSSVVVTTEDVYKLQKELLALPKKGAELKQILEVAIFANSKKMHYTENYCPTKYRQQSQNTKMKNNLLGLL